MHLIWTKLAQKTNNFYFQKAKTLIKATIIK
jgi:hypothetical protein